MMLLEGFPKEDEGEISRRHAALVKMETLARIAVTLDLGNFINMSRGEERMGGREQPAVLADTCEAIIAALYLDGGLDAASNFIRSNWQTVIDQTPLPPKDAKTMLQEWAQQKGLYAQVYDTTEELDEAIKAFAQNLCNYNPEAVKEMKQMFWRGTEDWDELLNERAKISGRLVLSEFTKKKLEKYQ